MTEAAGGIKKVKTVIGYAAHARLMAVLGESVGYVRRMPVRTPYSWSPVHAVYQYRGRRVIVAETTHRTYMVLAIPAGVEIRNRETEAMADFHEAGGLEGYRAAVGN